MGFLEFLKVIVFGIVEGITEWLPISSTGHMIILEDLMPLKVSAEFMEMFRVVIQLGAILAVCILFFHKLNPFSPRKNRRQKKQTWRLWSKVIVGCIPAGILGILLNDWFDAHFYNSYVVAATLIIYGVLFILLERRNKRRYFSIERFSQLTYQDALIVGAFQVLSLIPGTSRSGATILGAMLIGISRPIAAEFSFFMSIPVMFGASLLKLVKFGFHYTGTEVMVLIVGMVSAFIVSVVAIKFLMSYIRKKDFSVFGVYRIVLGVLVLLYFFVKK
ncbi:undecaprenyl-diphosphate phosphatase [Qiania dongpingensis]|uniref:Undecaprenyl-diphosphatase n=1 Tax=Qiania dongpingensis TaxID=2763669 RepID=A0A7G9G618_9FIRM|nr:undecaprenyl-diphosphate phosphatase [Qiania dongpingensis]QNM06250.1 undecaprenyl-diphosphate phosphatase [Qiania dongpingensis]